MPGDATFLYAGLRVRDLDRSLRFYRRLGFRVERRGAMAHGGRWAHLRYGRSAQRLELNFYPRTNPYFEPFRRGTEFDHLGFYAPDPIAFQRRAVRAGGRPVLEFVDGRSRLVYIADPDGNWIEAFGPLKPRRRRRSKP
jgi:catechol 2,3-dioxygenase-like lactoylglutathione lyase family enzyme